MCDNRNQTKCLTCESPLLEYEGSCVSSCPTGTSPNFFRTSCTSTFLFNFPSIPYPHLIACAVMLIFCLIGELKARNKTLFITGFIVLWGPIEFISFLSLTYFSYAYQTYKVAAVSAFAAIVYVILNISFAITFNVKIATKDIEYLQWKTLYPKTSKVLMILSGLLSHKILRLHYCYLYGFECFKARFQFPGVFQRLILIFTIIHFFFCNCIIIGVDVVGLLSMPWGTQLNITMQESGAMAIVLILLDIVELCQLRKYLGDDERVDYDALLNQMNETMDKKLR